MKIIYTNSNRQNKFVGPFWSAENSFLPVVTRKQDVLSITTLAYIPLLPLNSVTINKNNFA